MGNYLYWYILIQHNFGVSPLKGRCQENMVLTGRVPARILCRHTLWVMWVDEVGVCFSEMKLSCPFVAR